MEYVDERSTEEILESNSYYSYIRTDRNGTRYFSNSCCDRCGGKGVIPCYGHVDGGVCFECGGSGFVAHATPVKIYTRARYEKLEADRAKRAENKEKLRIAALEANRGANLVKAGFSEDSGEYVIYRVVGNTYSIKDELKALGCKFNRSVGWFSNKELDNYETQRLTESQVLVDSLEIEWKDKADLEELFLENQRRALNSTSTFIGEIGDRIEVSVHIDRRFESAYRINEWKSISSYMYLLSDAAGNIYKWSTSSWLNEGEDINLKGTVKDHCEFRGEKQTVLTRCKQL